ncbi:uncharacterized protein BDZ99DRAFT_448877 [Mytilinidion resinicola]|uniref:VASt domain-containing protein n=1 Tax=Mytilinidion resinicola TaxID=574789 RepID=A0A6A6YEA3_9PEZI|nr:uncharacterized protein BDZ99DRAFT_448877 [Mytilinidion resinicola]KAF2806177.1 hypothetical protein BDZ99DRAFT_448877 [Mytilinidion resinicola]
MLKGRRKSKPNNSSTNSIASSDTHGDGSSGMRSSLDGALEKLKTRNSEDRRDSTESTNGTSNGTRDKMSKLFKGRRRRRQSNAQDGASHESSQLDLTEDIPPLPSTSMLSLGTSAHSEESLHMHRSVPSSLLTEDSDTDSPPIRPSISPHQSHTGYLTLSSPLISAEALDSPASISSVTEHTPPLDDTLAPRNAKTLSANSEPRRSPSPVGKLKEAFAPTRRSTSPKPGGDSDSTKSGLGGGLGGLFGGVGKKGGSTLRRGSSTLEEPPLIHISHETQSTPVLPSASPPEIITTIPATPPNLGEAPTTLVTPPTPTDAKASSPTDSNTSLHTSTKPVSHKQSQSNSNIVTSPSGNMISHRRVRSATNPPSKLSNSISAPLTPTLEETKTPGGSLSSPQSNSGFFSSVFSAAQNAATQLSTSIANTSISAGSKNKANNSQPEEEKTGDVGGEEVIGPESEGVSTEIRGNEPRQLAVETLGSGDLSLAHLGISESSDPSPMTSKSNLAEPLLPNDHASAKAEDVAAAQAVSAAYASEKPNGATNSERPRSLTTLSGGGVSPPRIPDALDSPGSVIQRTGSIRSRISGGRKRRHRGSSATTGHTIAAAVGASTATLAHPAAMANGQRLQGTGFAVAPAKRNRDFHNLFRSVPEDDYLIEDYSAALQRDILLHGRLYVSEGHICFSSNILGWVTNLVISFDEIVTVEKKSTAVIFPNAIVIQTLHARNVFASFVSRDSTYDLIIGIWKISHPNLKSSVNGVTLDGTGTGDKTEKDESVGSEDGSIDGSDDEVYDEDAEDEEGLGSFTEAGEGSVAGSEGDSIQAASRKASAAALGAPVSGGTSKIVDNAEAALAGATATQDFPGSPTHAPTECGDADSHYDKLLIDTTIAAPLGKIYSLMFGPASGQFMRKWHIEDQKSTELQMEDDKKGLDQDIKTMNISYIKPLGGGLGPKQTKCLVAMTLEQFDLDRAVTVLCSTQTPDVPSGNVFLTKTRYCLMWGPGNSTRLIMTCTVEWSGKSWLKGPIEKGANDGQMSFAKDITAALRAAVTTKAAIKGAPRGRGKGRKRRGDISIDEGLIPTPGDEIEKITTHKPVSWGVLEPLHGPLGPVVDIVGSFVSGPTVIAVLFALLLVSWLRRPAVPGLGSLGVPGLATPQRVAAYEEMWRKEESELWRWLEERVVIDRVLTPPVEGQAWRKKQRVGGMQEKLVEEKMSERQIDEAIKVTQERLEALKEAVERRREH